jgi:hypothetical protein
MIGAIAGDIIGSAYEWNSTKSLGFELFTPESTPTDDTILTIAVADCILHGKEYAVTFKEYGQRYPNAGYGGMFREWLNSNSLVPYNSFGNGSAMRVSPVGFSFNTLEKVIAEATKTAEVTHNHREGIKGARAVAAAIYLARQGETKEQIHKYIERTFEKSRLKELAKAFPEYKEWIDGIIERIVDLNAPFKDFSYYHPLQLGSASLKQVLPVLTDLSYKDMEIGEGTTASLKFMEAAFGNVSDEERQKIQADLLTYCGQDTGGMIDILKKLRELIDY